MSTKPLQDKIFLTITNPGKLQPGASPRFDFDKAGGTIGSRGANWMLSDIHHQINPIHCEIAWVDGTFCVIDRCGDTRINNSTDGIGAGHMAQLNDGDMLQVGPYKISVYFDEIQNALPDASKSLGQYSVGELVNENARHFTENMPMTSEQQPPENTSETKSSEFNRLSSSQSKVAIDPLAALDAQSRNRPATTSMPLDPTHFGKSPMDKTQPDFTSTASEAVSRSPSPHNDAMNYQLPQTPYPADYVAEQEWQNAYEQAGSNAQHLAALPLLRGLQANLGSMDSTASYDLLFEAGKSLKAAIEGISRLYDDPNISTNHLSMLTRTLQPIEDNPLRLRQNYEDTVRTMFSEYRSAVHLSAPAAIEESLEQARVHNLAIIEAIGESLNALLKAFSPSVLFQRFQRYNADTNTQTGDDGWAWRMYNHYYDELTSSRQQGFEKLFWEVFEQVYDRAMRERTS